MAMERIPTNEETSSPILTSTYVIFLYRALGWDISDSGVLPVVGLAGPYTSFNLPISNGENATLIDGLASGIVVFRVDSEIESFFPTIVETQSRL